MSGCCDQCVDVPQSARQRSVLRAVLVINAVAFVVMLFGAWRADSSALFSDGFDYLGDALTYVASLWAVGRGAADKARVAWFKGALILLAAVLVLGQLGWRLGHPALPGFDWMLGFTVFGLAANGVCLWLLTRHRADDVNMASVWECSRNDIAANLSVLVAAGGVWWFAAAWPDRVVALALSLLLLRSGWRVLRGAASSLRQASPTGTV
jgi:Co/Zn/Cd efflux system component